MIKEWEITFPKSTIVKAETVEGACEEAIKEIRKFWAICMFFGNEPIKEIKKG